MEDLKWFVGFLIFFIVAWFISGGILRNVESPFIAPPIPVGNAPTPPAQKTGELAKDLKSVEEQSGISPLRGKLELSTGSYGAALPAEEYLTLHLSESAASRVLLTGMTLKSNASGRTATIGKGAYLPQQATVNAEEPLYLEPGGTAYIVTGRSPTGYSFRINKCTGYFAQFQRFTPTLPSQCPLSKQEPLPPPPNALSDACLEFIDTMRRCRIEPNPPETLQEECIRFVRDTFTYPRCAASHKGDADFYKNEWRIYLSHDTTLWKSTREVITLVDPSGKAVDTVTY